MEDTIQSEPTRGAGYWAMAVVAAVLILFGIPIFAGGIWLIALGGSWYYAIAGIGLIASGALMLRRNIAGLWVYLATYVFTLAWAFWEVGTDWWGQVPRLVAPTVLLIAVLACIPVFRRRDERNPATAEARMVTAGLLFAIALGGTSLAQIALAPAAHAQATTAQSQPAQVQQDNAASPADSAARPALPMAKAGEDWPAYGGTIHATRVSRRSTEITPDNVGKLEQAWDFRTGDLPNEKTKGKYSPEDDADQGRRPPLHVLGEEHHHRPRRRHRHGGLALRPEGAGRRDPLRRDLPRRRLLRDPERATRRALRRPHHRGHARCAADRGRCEARPALRRLRRRTARSTC